MLKYNTIKEEKGIVEADLKTHSIYLLVSNNMNIYSIYLQRD